MINLQRKGQMHLPLAKVPHFRLRHRRRICCLEGWTWLCSPWQKLLKVGRSELAACGTIPITWSNRRDNRWHLTDKYTRKMQMNTFCKVRNLQRGRWEWAARRRTPSTLCFCTWKTRINDNSIDFFIGCILTALSLKSILTPFRFDFWPYLDCFWLYFDHDITTFWIRFGYILALLWLKSDTFWLYSAIALTKIGRILSKFYVFGISPVLANVCFDGSLICKTADSVIQGSWVLSAVVSIEREKKKVS